MIEKLSKYIRLLRKYNKLETEYEILLEYTKDDCFKKLIDKLGEPLELKRLRDENKRLRIKLKALKEDLKKQNITFRAKK